MRVFGTVVVVVSVVACPAIFIYAAKQPSEPMEGVAILSDTVIAANRSKLETQPIAWGGIAAIFLGAGTGATREWTRREDARTSATLEWRYGFSPAPGRGVLDRFCGGCPDRDFPGLPHPVVFQSLLVHSVDVPDLVQHGTP
ncbi:MAG TPA: hypothetical protein QGH28_00295, partial [Chloroflexota bacterium]|nr:hypothetical protein [Chloroflexota bacterium]